MNGLLHFYLMLNVAIIGGYLIARFILGFEKRISSSQRLKLARVIFITAILAFILAPILSNFMPAHYYSKFEFTPIIKSASVSMVRQNSGVNNSINHSIQTPLSFNTWLMLLLFAGILISLLKYVKNIIALIQLSKNSYRCHVLNNVSILYSQTTTTPFCWAFLNSHYVVIPYRYLEEGTGLKLALSHELQHIRQGDTYWLQVLGVIKTICFCNPITNMWMKWFEELQEYACDESVLNKKTILATEYAQCLLNAVTYKQYLPACALGMSASILYRRVNMIFNNQKKSNKLALIIAYGTSALLSISTAFALNGTNALAPLSMQEVQSIIKHLNIDKSFQLSATPEVVREINNIRGSEQARLHLAASLQRMKQYEGEIKHQLQAKNMPNDLLTVPLMESGYQPLSENVNPVRAAGIWQIIPNTAKRLGLTINAEQDDRYDIQRSTKAALQLLKQDQQQFGDWKLAFVAYEIGENSTDKLIKTTGSHDAWTLARSASAPKDLKKSLAMFDAALIIMHKPALIS